MEFRRADHRDCLDLLAWRNDPAAVAASLTGAGVDEAAHRAWFARVLADPGRILLIAEADGAKLGMVRFDRGADGWWEVSINLDPAARGRGLAAAILRGGIGAAFAGGDRPPLSARVRRDNPASWKIFERCGFAVEEVKAGIGHFRLAPACPDS